MHSRKLLHRKANIQQDPPGAAAVPQLAAVAGLELLIGPWRRCSVDGKAKAKAEAEAGNRGRSSSSGLQLRSLNSIQCPVEAAKTGSTYWTQRGG